MSGDMLVVEVCEKYGWDYYTYLAQPAWFLGMITERMKIDAQKSKQEELKAKRKQ